MGIICASADLLLEDLLLEYRFIFIMISLYIHYQLLTPEKSCRKDSLVIKSCPQFGIVAIPSARKNTRIAYTASNLRRLIRDKLHKTTQNCTVYIIQYVCSRIAPFKDTK